MNRSFKLPRLTNITVFTGLHLYQQRIHSWTALKCGSPASRICLQYKAQSLQIPVKMEEKKHESWSVKRWLFIKLYLTAEEGCKLETSFWRGFWFLTAVKAGKGDMFLSYPFPLVLVKCLTFLACTNFLCFLATRQLLKYYNLKYTHKPMLNVKMLASLQAVGAEWLMHVSHVLFHTAVCAGCWDSSQPEAPD